MSKRKSLSKRLRFEVFKRDSFKCQYCGASAPDVLLQVDHIHPVAHGGDETDITNLITSCDSCNSGKSDKLLSETAAASKRKAQLDQLQERREQLEMMAEWQRGLLDLTEAEVSECADLWRAVTKTYYLNERGLETLRKHIQKFGVRDVMAAIPISAKYFQAGSDGCYTKESIELGWSKIGGICVVRRRESEHPEEAELYKIRAYAKRGLTYFVDWEAMRLLRAAVSWDIPTEDLWDVARTARSWTQFRDRVSDLITEARRREGEL